MAKIKAKKESVLKLRFTEHSGQEWELWENFYRDLVGALACKGFYIDSSGKTQGLVWIHQGTVKETLDKEIIKELAQKHSIEIEFEEEKKKEEKWIPVHEVILEKLLPPSLEHVSALAFLYAEKAKVPKEAIPKLLEFFEKELKSRELHRYYHGTHTYENLDKAIKNLKEQQKEEE